MNSVTINGQNLIQLDEDAHIDGVIADSLEEAVQFVLNYEYSDY